MPNGSDRRVFSDDTLIEVGHDTTGRWTVVPEVSKSSPGELGPLPIDRNSVVLITGGAGGVTAAAAKELAQRITAIDPRGPQSAASTRNPRNQSVSRSGIIAAASHQRAGAIW